MRIIWRRLLKNPTTRVISRDADVTQLKVEGLVCDTVCAVRTKRALQQLDGIEGVTVDLDSGIATIRGTAHEAEAYERAVLGAVKGRGVRRLIEAFAKRVRPEAMA